MGIIVDIIVCERQRTENIIFNLYLKSLKVKRVIDSPLTNKKKLEFAFVHHIQWEIDTNSKKKHRRIRSKEQQ